MFSLVLKGKESKSYPSLYTRNIQQSGDCHMTGRKCHANHQTVIEKALHICQRSIDGFLRLGDDIEHLLVGQERKNNPNTGWDGERKEKKTCSEGDGFIMYQRLYDNRNTLLQVELRVSLVSQKLSLQSQNTVAIG